MLWVTGAKHSTWWRLPGDCGGWGCFSLTEAGCLATVQPCVERPLAHGGHASPSASPLSLRQPSITESQIMKTWSKRRSIPLGLAEQPDRPRRTERKTKRERNRKKEREWWGERGYTPLCIVMLQLESLQSMLLLAKENALIWKSGHQDLESAWQNGLVCDGR